MNNFEKAVFVDFVARNLQDGANQIRSAMFVKFGYHDHYKLAAPQNHSLSYDLAPNIDDGGTQARNKILTTVVPSILQGATSPSNPVLFGFDISEDGFPYAVRESSIANMQNPLPHVFALNFYTPDRDGMKTTNNKERLQIVLYDPSGAPITLAKMMAQTTLVPPPSPSPSGCMGGP